MMRLTKVRLLTFVILSFPCFQLGAQSSFEQQDAGLGGFDRENSLKVVPVTEMVDADGFVGGKAHITLQFWIEAPHNKLNFYCVVTDMQRDRKKHRADENLVALDRAFGCRISPVNAYSTTNENSAIVKFGEIRTFLEGRDALQSDYVTFTTQDGANFRQNVFVKLVWNDEYGSLPVGQYKGAVQLIAEPPTDLRPTK